MIKARRVGYPHDRKQNIRPYRNSKTKEKYHETAPKETHQRSNTQPAYFLFFVFLVIFVFINIFAARHILLENTRSISQDLIRNYALDEERNLEVYENLIKLGMDYLKDQITSDTSQEELEHWLIDFCKIPLENIVKYPHI